MFQPPEGCRQYAEGVDAVHPALSAQAVVRQGAAPVSEDCVNGGVLVKLVYCSGFW